MDEQKLRNAIMMLAQQNALLFYNQLIAKGTTSDEAEYQALTFVLDVIAQYENMNVEALPGELKDEAMNRTRYIIHLYFPDRDNASN